MTYAPQNWVDNQTAVDAAAMNHIEAGVGAAAVTAHQPTNVKDHGAAGDGSVDDAAAFTRALQAGPGDVYMPAGSYRLTGTLDVPHGVNLVGAGRYATTISLGAGAQIRFSDADTNQNGGRSGGFLLTGNNQVGTALYIGRCSNRYFTDIRVHNCTGDNMVTEGTQNCVFVAVESAISGGSCLVYGDRSNNNTFVGCSFFDAAVAPLRFERTRDDQNPRRAQFFGGLAENVRAGGEASILIRAGVDLSFFGMQTSTENHADAPACVKVDQAVGCTVRYLRLRGMQLLSQAPNGVGIQVVKILRNNGDMAVDNCYWRNGSVGMDLTGDVRMDLTSPWGLADIATPVVKNGAVVQTPTMVDY